MPESLTLGTVHHVRLTVTDVERSRAFYTGVLGFQVAVEAPPDTNDPNYEVVVDTLQGGVVLTNAGILIGLRPVDAEREQASDRFDPFRVGMDHLSFNVPSRGDLESAITRLDEHGIEHGEIRDLVPFGISLLAFFDPDGVALELTAPHEG